MTNEPGLSHPKCREVESFLSAQCPWPTGRLLPPDDVFFLRSLVCRDAHHHWLANSIALAAHPTWQSWV